MSETSRVESSSATTGVPEYDGVDTSLPFNGFSASSMVMAIRSATRQARTEAGTEAVREAEDSREEQVEARLRAMERAEEARADAGFWGSIASLAKTIAIVATIAVGAVASVFTAGTSGLAAAAVVAALSAAPLVLPEVATFVAEKTNMGPLGRMVMQACVLAACIALSFINPSAVVNGAAQTGRAAAQATSTVAQVSSTAAETTSVAAEVAGSLKTLARCVQTAAQIQQGIAGIQGGLATIEEGQERAAAQRHEASGVEAEQRRDDAFAALEDLQQGMARLMRTVTQMAQIEHESALAAVRA